MSEASANYPTVLFGAASVAGALIGVFNGWWSVIPIALMILLFLAAWAIGHARSRKLSSERARLDADRERLVAERDDAIADLSKKEDEFEEYLKGYRESLLHHDLHNLLYLVVSAVATSERGARQTAARAARQSIVCTAARLVGESERYGTRANLFRFDTPQRVGSSDPCAAMTLEPGATAGRGVASIRRFDADHQTTQKTLKDLPQFVNVSSLEPEPGGEPLPYAAYATHPISVKGDLIHGALMVDSLTEGILEKRVDLPVLAVLTDLIAITYECEKYPKPSESRTSTTTIEPSPSVA